MPGQERLKHDLRRLTRPDPSVSGLGEAGNPTAMPARTGLGSATNGGDTAGIASPLTEVDFGLRMHYDEQTISSSDGLFTIKLRRLKRLVMTDANDSEVVFQFEEP